MDWSSPEKKNEVLRGEDKAVEVGPEVCGLWLQVDAVEEGREVEVGEDLGALVAARLVVLGQQEQFQPPPPPTPQPWFNADEA